MIIKEGKKMRNLILIALIFTVGCATSSVQHTASFTHAETGKETNFTTMTLTEVNAFAPTTAVKFVLECEVSEKKELSKTRCVPSNVGRQDSAPGIVVGFGSTVINSAAIVGGAHLMGKGISESGDRETRTETRTETNNDNGIIQTGQNAVVGDPKRFTSGTHNHYNK